MGKRLLAHLFITLATLSLMGTYFIWVVDATLFNPIKLSSELKKSGFNSELAAVLTDRVVADMEGANKEENRAKVANVITPKYIDRKLSEAATSLTTYMKNGTPEPRLDLTDFPGQVRAAGIDISEKQAAAFDTPISFNQNETLNWLPRGYQILQNVKYLGIVLFVVFMVIEMFLSPVGTKLKRAGRVFLHTGLWFFMLWAALIFVPGQLAPKAKQALNDASLNELTDTVIKTIQQLFSVQFLGFAIVCGVIAGTTYAIWHSRRHIEKIKDVPTARIKNRSQVRLPR